MRDYIIQCAIHTQGNYQNMKRMIAQETIIPLDYPHQDAIVIGDVDYPIALYDLKEPPFVLFYKGDPKLLKAAPCISVIGSRKPSSYALRVTRDLVQQLAPKFVVVSGLAKGIDACAHFYALDFRSVAVLGCGIDVYYPRENKVLQDRLIENHCIISEYPAGTSPMKHHFPFRNRIIAALSKDVYVMAAAHRSGTMRTVEEAMKINRNVTCLPHDIYEFSGQGCNTLIKDGANVLTEHDIKQGV